MTLHKPQQERHRDILASARRRFIADGYAGARLNDIAGDAGLSKGGVYFHFKSKREIFDALIADDSKRDLERLEAMKAEEGSAADKLLRFVSEGLRESVTDPIRAKFRVVMGDMALADPDIRARLKELHDAVVVALRELIVSGAAGGGLRADLDAEIAANVVLVAMDGLRVAVAAEFHEPELLERLVDQGVGRLVLGFVAPAAVAA